MKKKIGPLSISGILALFLTFASCKSGFLPFNTTVAVQSERVSPVVLTEKRLLIVSYDSELTQEFVISLKNYVAEELKTHKIIVERINIRNKQAAADLADFNKLKNTFAPDYLMAVKVRDERTRKMFVIGGNVKTLRGMTVYFNLLPIASEENEGAFQWRSTAVVNHFYNSELVTTAKKIARELGFRMQKDLLVN
jgi:hypothetical protein